MNLPTFIKEEKIPKKRRTNNTSRENLQTHKKSVIKLIQLLKPWMIGQ